MEARVERTEIHPIALGFDTCYVLRARGTVVLDAGQPNKGCAFADGLERAGIRPDEVRLILLTHAHWDHMGSAAELKEITGAPLAVHAREAAWVRSGEPPLPPGITPWGRAFMAMHRLAMPLIDVPPAEVDIELARFPLDLEEFGVPGTVIHTPGHSPGSVSVVLESGEAFVGDLAMNRLPLTSRPSLSIFGDDPEALQASWERVLEFGPARIYPAHGAPFSPEAVVLSGVPAESIEGAEPAGATAG